MLKKYLRIDLSKNTKFTFYVKSLINYFTPSKLFQKQLAKHLKTAEQLQEILDRVNYYNKTHPFECDENLPTIKEFYKEKKKTYFFDLLVFLKYFNQNLKISYLFGDITHVPKIPTIVKSRPIEGDNTNSILMKLNSVRHFIFVNDKTPFHQKKNMLVWRGKSYVAHRTEFLKKYYLNPLCDIGQTNTKKDTDAPWQKKKLSLKQQLQYKFILAIEGNDVASNLKWAMSSNSLVFMTKPKYETWFMEGKLIPNYHYVLLKDDYSDLEEKLRYYNEYENESLEIISNAHTHVAMFQNSRIELLTSLMVLAKYFKNSHQLQDDLKQKVC